MSAAPQPRGWRDLTGHVAVRSIFKSVGINLAAPALLYRLASQHLPATSLLPLAISGIPPILWLAFSVLKLRAIDFLGLFAAENVVVSMAALVLAHSERGALIGRSMQNVILAAVFVGSLATARPLMFHMARQLSTGNDPVKRRSFDLAATSPEALRSYRVLTLGWTVALLIKAAGSYWLGAHFAAKEYLLFSPVWDIATDSVLVTASILYGRRALATPQLAAAPVAVPTAVP
jgi:hypothetical protein